MSGAKDIRIAPSILSCDFGRLTEEVTAVEEGGADWIHVDVMDGHFVPNITIGPLVVRAAAAATRLPIDVHLMIESPDRYLEAFRDAGADILTVHVEACIHLHRTIQEIRRLGMRPGVALNPATPLKSVQEIVSDLDLLLVMSVNPGFGGQSYIQATTGKVERARRLLDDAGSEAVLEVDGGISADNAAEVVRAGATALVAGSAVYGHSGGPGAGVRAIRASLAS
jgi:ribulose-phosphate 3-epimerase